MNEKNDKFPDGFEAFLLVIVLFFAEYFIALLLRAMQEVISMNASDVSGIVMLLGNACIFSFVMHHKSMTYRDLFHPSSSSVKATLLVLLPAMAMTVPALVLSVSWLVDALEWLVPMSSWQRAMFEDMGSGSVGALVIGCILAPVLEEMLFRGIVLRSFLRQYARWPAILGSATLFGFAHLNIYQFVVGVILGSFSGWLYERTRSLWPCIALHAMYNTTVLYSALAGAGDSGENSFDVSGATWITYALLCAVGASLLSRLLRAPAPAG